MIQSYRLTNEPEGTGLSCTPEGLSLAGVPLLRKTQAGFALRPAPEIASLIKAAYGADGAPTRLESGLDVIARALNEGDLARAAIAAVQTRTRELSAEAAARLAKADAVLAKSDAGASFDPEEPRDWHGRWTKIGDGGPASRAKPDDEKPHGREDLEDYLAHAASDDHEEDDESRAPSSFYQELEQKYDWQGPVDFAKQVIQFGDRLGRQGKNFSRDEKERALAEYSFLQDRLNFWLGYDYKPPLAQENLHSAALTLFQGAINGGIVGAGQIPASMLDVAVGAMAYDNLPQRAPRSPPRVPSLDEMVAREGIEAPREIKGLSGTAYDSDVALTRPQGIKEQGHSFEVYIARERSDLELLPRNSKTFDLFGSTTGEAVSAKTVSTLSVGYIKRPERLYWLLKRYIDSAADYEPRPSIDLDPQKIKSKTLHVAISEHTSPMQLRYLRRAKRYGLERGVSVEITDIRE